MEQRLHKGIVIANAGREYGNAMPSHRSIASTGGLQDNAVIVV